MITNLSAKKEVKNASQHVQQVLDLLQHLDADVKDMHLQVQVLKADFKLFDSRIHANIEEFYDAHQPSIQKMDEDLKASIVAQKELNEFMQNQVTDLRRERSILQQLSSGCSSRAQELLQEVGKY